MCRLEWPVFEIIVGTGEDVVVWNIPKALLSAHSEFFRAACYGRFKEGIENKISFSDVIPAVFRSSVQWLYCWPISLLVRGRLYILLGDFGSPVICPFGY